MLWIATTFGTLLIGAAVMLHGTVALTQRVLVGLVGTFLLVAGVFYL